MNFHPTQLFFKIVAQHTLIILGLLSYFNATQTPNT